MLDHEALEAQIKYMVERFLRWNLPENFSPDCGISFQRDYNQNTPWPTKHEPTGTNLFDYSQSTEMVRYMLDGSPALAAQGEAAVAVKPLAPPASAKVVGKWEIDNSTPSPILTYEKCSVIQDEQAHYVLGLIQADVSPASGVSETMVEAAKALDLHLDKLICYASTCSEYEPNKAVRDFRNALEAALANGAAK